MQNVKSTIYKKNYKKLLTYTARYGTIVLYLKESTKAKKIYKKERERKTMRKTELKNEIEKVIDELMNYKLSEMLLQSVNEAQNDIDKNETADILKEDLNLLTAWLDDFKKDNTAEKVEKADTKKALETKAAEKAEKATFKWVSLDGYKMVSVKNSSFKDVTTDTIIAYRMDKIVVENLKKRKIEYSDIMTFNNATFNNGIDYCKITEITDSYIEVESIKNVGAQFRIWADNFKKCIDDTNISFRILQKTA